ncbi:5286_t:CDS:2 [Funneliformis geosporum]|uniref:DNA 3'-5' helicase n=1 Tax=Funneliformis geosporum TaxID=1117311 RepID=A0A9W4STK6_9GLOM|nr:1813_t:CDS:2 [Funneliformis geosporum]CAI2183115.1 5286_t:CDS:2 [Funneliformis geosporum]
MEFLQELNESQKKAVYEEHSRICVIAGPGCGKTKTLVSRLIYLLASQKAQPQNILVLTFAKKAIKEIKKRVFSHITTVSPKDLHIYNFHSFCFQVLNKYSHLLGFPDSKFPVYDRHEQETIIRKILYQNNHSAEKKEINTILAYISEYLKTNKALDFNDLLLYTIELFNYHSQVRQEYQKQFTHILLDEFQDINSIQWEVINLILSKQQNVFLVAKNQSILVNNILNTSKPEGVKVNFLTRKSIRYLVYQLRRILIQEKLQFNDIAILYRNNYLSTRLEQELVAQRIPYEILGSFKFIEREEIKDVLSFLRTIIYLDNISLLRILGFQEKVGTRTIEKIEQNSERERVSIYEYLNNFATITNLSGEKFVAGQIEKISTAILKINQWREKLEQKVSLSNFLLGVLNDFDYWKHLKTRINASEREKNVQQFLNIAQN